VRKEGRRTSNFELAEIHRLYECLDLLLKHKRALFDHLTQHWKDLFNAKYEVLLYDLTSTYFENDPPFSEKDMRKFGYSRDKRFDCVQVVIALIVTPERGTRGQGSSFFIVLIVDCEMKDNRILGMRIVGKDRRNRANRSNRHSAIRNGKCSEETCASMT